MVFDRDIITQNAQETTHCGQTLARDLTQQLPRSGETRHTGHMICLYGELGSGKTTYVQGFAQGLGINTRLLSPTYIIVRRYGIPNCDNFLYHIDLYRVNTPQELDELGLSEILTDSSSFVLVEWADKLGELLPESRYDIRFSVLENGHHDIRIKHY